mmetsp:Transcript_59660/g.187085  ORF Transcript_59660/g.187085 Transcript_59660/m.187085 type:complete len:217 (+) Transcript_59660:772-1422(+)
MSSSVICRRRPDERCSRTISGAPVGSCCAPSLASSLLHGTSQVIPRSKALGLLNTRGWRPHCAATSLSSSSLERLQESSSSVLRVPPLVLALDRARPRPAMGVTGACGLAAVPPPAAAVAPSACRAADRSSAAPAARRHGPSRGPASRKRRVFRCLRRRTPFAWTWKRFGCAARFLSSLSRSPPHAARGSPSAVIGRRCGPGPLPALAARLQGGGR